jgi:hypothetical protein
MWNLPIPKVYLYHTLMKKLITTFLLLILSLKLTACPNGFEPVRMGASLGDLIELNALAYIKKRIDLDYQTRKLGPPGEEGFFFTYSPRPYRRFLKPDTLRKVSVFNNFCEIGIQNYQRSGHFWIRLKKCGDRPLANLPAGLFEYVNFCLPQYGPRPI